MKWTGTWDQNENVLGMSERVLIYSVIKSREALSKE